MDAISIHLLPALPPTPSLPIIHNFNRNSLAQLFFKCLCAVSLVSGTCRGSDSRYPSRQMEIIFTRSLASQKSAFGEFRWEDIEDEVTESFPMCFGLVEEAHLDFFGDLAFVDREETAVALLFRVVELFMGGSVRGRGVFV